MALSDTMKYGFPRHLLFAFATPWLKKYITLHRERLKACVVTGRRQKNCRSVKSWAPWRPEDPKRAGNRVQRPRSSISQHEQSCSWLSPPYPGNGKSTPHAKLSSFTWVGDKFKFSFLLFPSDFWEPLSCFVRCCTRRRGNRRSESAAYWNVVCWLLDKYY